ncbi:tetratricopeptide repeat protein [Flavobacterium sp. LS1R49]|uniref:Tetratricopeptide repeat protein n=1 Tax=Flavobacterium shii TaxID=2987687 RepID=A0A9X3C5C8_9FLAO|nr:tetratricopeptide repeat protein [Flavobacterium shii]MCV9926937.1 tetratricopeptide repeat protein [Flavobacterium shii]
MKNILTTLLFLMTILCHSKSNELYDRTNFQNFRIKDSTYFSFSSSCNIQLEISDAKNAILNINGKTKKGTIIKNKYSKGFFDFKENNIVIITFSFEDSNIVVENQKYQFECEGAKFIILDKIKNDNESLVKVKNYLNENQTIFDENIESINDKAYFLEKINQYKSSAYILEKIIERKPDRVVAWLNLGDVYWELNKKEEAQTKYLKYISLMKTQKKDLKKIPQRVNERILNN